VAVKALPAYPADDTVARVRFRLVARTVLQVSGQGIAQVHDFGEAAQPEGMAVPYLVRELASGQALDQRLERAPLAVGDALRIVASVAAALAVAHRAGVPHGHVIPANIVLGAGNVTVTDFGLSALRLPPAGDTPRGGLSYAAPELAGGGPATPAADMYALGVVFVACLAGITSHPRPAAQPEAGDRTALSALELESVPASLASLWAACLGPNPAERPTAAHAAVMARQVLHRDSAAWSAEPWPVAQPGQPAETGPVSPTAAIIERVPVSEPEPEPEPEPGLVPAGDGSDRDRAGPPGPRARRPRSRRGRLIALGGVVTGAAAAAAVVGLLVTSLNPQRAVPAASATTDLTSTAAVASLSPSPAGRAPAPDATSSVLTSTPGSSGSAASLSPRAALGRLSRTIRADVANGQIRQDVGVDLDNLIAPVQAELAAGEQAPVAQLVGTLRAKLRTRESEGALTATAASVLNGELDMLERSSGT
jgi:eukaryotic-like serine/threonine-protein kinase